MTRNEFNKKWKNFLEDGHYGMAINNPDVIKYLDKEFENEIKENKEFSFSQIKIKFGFSRVYADSSNIFKWEDEIDKIIGESNLINRKY